MAKEKFEDALAKLEEIVKKMESGDLSLEDSLKSFEEGIRLVRVCSRKLDEAQRRVELLLQEEGETVAKPYREEDSED
ncbi:MAG: Exodeoxyribonuclease 7 small subunit [Syntrophaceae bacterium PtaU1.Bin231]|nr:MAG: Exodeoxyribonuclease 7 small subunit [Syntrophaceae bacterium PtaU1.Bin231]